MQQQLKLCNFKSTNIVSLSPGGYVTKLNTLFCACLEKDLDRTHKQFSFYLESGGTCVTPQAREGVIVVSDVPYFPDYKSHQPKNA